MGCRSVLASDLKWYFEVIRYKRTGKCCRVQCVIMPKNNNRLQCPPVMLGIVQRCQCVDMLVLVYRCVKRIEAISLLDNISIVKYTLPLPLVFRLLSMIQYLVSKHKT